MTSIELPFNNPEGKPEEIRDAVSNPFAQRVTSYIEESLSNSDRVLRPHQLDVFEDLQTFFEQGKRKGSIILPTGTGKTVLFVELSKALLGVGEVEEKKPKILVVTPTKDLVHQTLGRKGQKGYGRFAPELNVGSYFSDTPDKERRNLDDYDVVITTFQSFNTFNIKDEYRSVNDFEKDVLESDLFKSMAERVGYESALEVAKGIKAIPTGRTLLDKFDVIILDEAHHALGEKTSRVLQALPENKIVIGFSATLEDVEYLPKIHEMTLNEAIALGLLAPVTPLGIKSGVRIEGSDIFDEDGEFIDSKISYLARDPHRNQIIIETAKVMAQKGIGTIISCIAGDEVWHAKHIAALANNEGLRAVAIHSQIPAERRKELYEEFEQGKIDILSFIGVLSEGWDSERAKAIINARPTRSQTFATQRLGRITRPNGDMAFAIDIYDEHDGKNPPITVADVLKENNIVYGTKVGVLDDDFDANETLQSLRENTPVLDSLPGDYYTNQMMVSVLEKLTRGIIKNEKIQYSSEYALPTIINRNYKGVTEEILEKIEALTGEIIDRKLAARGKAVQTVYNVDQAKRMLHSLPKVDPLKYHFDEKKHKWISIEGIVRLFSKRFPGVSSFEISDLLSRHSDVDWIPALFESSKKSSQYRHFSVIKLYDADQASIESFGQLFTKNRRVN